MTEALPVPESIASNENAIELVRVWAAKKNQHVTIDVGTWNDPLIWGLLLADLVRQIAIAYEQDGQMGREDAATLIKQRMDSEW